METSKLLRKLCESNVPAPVLSAFKLGTSIDDQNDMNGFQSASPFDR